ncbi:Secretin XpsD [Usitatibacter rugosus]|uniref:Secretin XpsD n=2 Tax=Usitatibacter rugosus TaxID=2732067 RepID=A0A6M4H053_9PROT|nr:Secretin XpsD [Usitatibacter rugosus]
MMMKEDTMPQSPISRVPRALYAAFALAAVLALPGCKMLPPHGFDAPTATPAASGAPAEFGPARPAAQPPAQATAPQVSSSESKVFPGTGVFVSPRPLKPAGPSGPEEASLNFEGLDIREVAKVILGDYLRESYTVHPAVAGTVTFRTIKPISRKELLPTLEMLLRQNNAALVQEEGVYKILPITAVRGSVSPQLGNAQSALPAGFSVIVVPLRYVGAKEMERLLQPFAADNTVRVDEVRNLIIIAGHQREMKHLMDTIELFDVDWLTGYSVGLFPIKSADVKTLVTELDKVFGPAGQGPLAGIVRVIPIERLNALLVVTTQARYLELAKTWVDRLDQLGGTSGGTRFFVYYVKNGKAENLAQLIGDLFSGRRSASNNPSLAPGARPAEIRSQTPYSQPGAPNAPAAAAAPASAVSFNMQGGVGSTASEVRVIADKDTNSLLILAAPSDYDVIEGALRKLDVVPRQVLVEVLLAEVRLSDELTFGINWFLNGRNGSNTTGAIRTGGLPVTADLAVPLLDPGFQLVSRSGDLVRAVLNSLGKDGKAQVLASPQLMVLDNQKAQFKVGDRISVQTQTQTGVNTGAGVLNSYQYLETGVLLTITPRINSGNQVTLEVNQEVSDPVAGTGGTAVNPNPDVTSRSVQTTVVIASGESVVLAGMIREASGHTGTGVPILSKIPVLGAAFGSQTWKRDRTELVLVITPRIVSDSRQAQDASDELRRKLPMLENIIKDYQKGMPLYQGAPPAESAPPK